LSVTDMASQETITHPLWSELCLILLADSVRLCLALLQLDVYLQRPSKAVANHMIHICKLELRILLYDFFWRSTVSKSSNHCVRRNARFPNAHSTMRVDFEGYDFVGERADHRISLQCYYCTIHRSKVYEKNALCALSHPAMSRSISRISRSSVLISASISSSGRGGWYL
jgi:hypothetical protein